MATETNAPNAERPSVVETLRKVDASPETSSFFRDNKTQTQRDAEAKNDALELAAHRELFGALSNIRAEDLLRLTTYSDNGQALYTAYLNSLHYVVTRRMREGRSA